MARKNIRGRINWPRVTELHDVPHLHNWVRPSVGGKEYIHLAFTADNSSSEHYLVLV